MDIKEKEFTLKDGRKAVMRSPVDEDAQNMLDYLYLTACETHFVIREPEECSELYTIEAEKDLFAHYRSADNRAMIICIVDGKIAGCCDIYWSKMFKLSHAAHVAIAVTKEFWGLGVAATLFQEMMNIAEQNENILQIELEFIEGNARARAFYEKFGFRICGESVDAIRLKDGRLVSTYIMKKKIER